LDDPVWSVPDDFGCCLVVTSPYVAALQVTIG